MSNLNDFKAKVTALQNAANQLPADTNQPNQPNQNPTNQNPANTDAVKQALDAVNAAFANIHA